VTKDHWDDLAIEPRGKHAVFLAGFPEGVVGALAGGSTHREYSGGVWMSVAQG